MTTIDGGGPNRLRFVLWAAQVLSVLMMTALAWWLPELIELSPVPDASLVLVVIAVAAVPVTVLIARLFGVGAADGAGYGSRPMPQRPAALAVGNPPAGGQALGRYVAVIALAEVPAVLGLVYVVLGGPRPNAVMLGGASLVLLLLYRPKQRPERHGPIL
jgi:hypothetical protein